MSSTMEKVYQDAQKACGLKVGDYVRVLRKADYLEAGWANGWASKIVQTIGETGKIIVIKEDGISVSFPAPIDEVWAYPYYVLEKVDGPEGTGSKTAPENKKFKVGDWVRITRKARSDETPRWNAEKMDDNVGKVGCICEEPKRHAAVVHVIGGNNSALFQDGFVYPLACLEHCEKPEGADYTPPENNCRNPFAALREAEHDRAERANKLCKHFSTEDEALAYARRVAAMKAGDTVMLPNKDSTALHKAVFTGSCDEDGDPVFMWYMEDKGCLCKQTSEWARIVLID